MNQPKPKPNRFARYVLPPIVLLAIALIIIAAAASLKPESAKKEPQPILPIVETIVAKSAPVQVEARSQGTAQARTETLLVAEVSGRVLEVSPKLYSGSFFNEGDVLVTIDPVEYAANLAAARSRLAEARLAIEQERAAAAQAIEDWKAMGKGEAPALARREPQIERAQAAIAAAEAGVLLAERDLERAKIRAPYAGQVREKFVDIGQMVNARSSQIARIYSIDTAEIRLPFSLDDLRYLDLPESYAGGDSSKAKPAVVLESEIGGTVWKWSGVIDRVEGAIDPRTRLGYVVAQVQNPYQRDPSSERPPLKPGLWLNARIQGKQLASAIRLPRHAVRNDNQIYVINPDDRLSIRHATIYKADTETAIVTDGLKDGERVCVTPLEYAVDGMKVRFADQAESQPPAANSQK